jgi:N-acetylneuraminic acid mutarotase
VAIVDAGDDPSAEADLGMYRAQYALPPCTTANGCFEKVNQDGEQGSYPPSNGDWPVEESLDIDMVSAACPNCHILLVEANSADVADLGTAEDEAVALGAKYVSNSYGTGDQSDELQWDAYYNHPGVAVTASAGDDGYGVEYPAASPYVTAVGGTTLTQDPSVPRGWSETAWSGTGSGCSAYEPKPAWQTDTGCANRTVADVSAVADPNTGVAVYDSGDGGWLVVGGTSVASPLIASVYALAGQPASNYPSAYPYANAAALNDVTSGSNGTCTPAYLCTASPGYDGPTGLGTPNGVTAFSAGPHGQVTGTVTNASTGAPVADVLVKTDRYQAVTGPQGTYDLELPPGRYRLRVSAYGYAPQVITGVRVTKNASVTENAALASLPTATVSGRVVDGSGHGWPLYAEITVDGDPGPPVYTSPYTGRFTLALPQSASYKLQVAPVAAGYQNVTATVHLGTTSVTKRIGVPIDASACDAPGYGFSYQGLPVQDFDGDASPAGWTVTDNIGTGNTWQHLAIEDGLANTAGGTGGYEYVDIAAPVPGQPYPTADTSLVSPAINLTGVSDPVIGFDTQYYPYLFPSFGTETTDVDVSTDGGQTWTTAWQQTQQGVEPPGYVQVSIPQAAGQSDVEVRFHAIGFASGDVWQLDNVFVGSRTCAALPGGLVAGVVQDANTGDPVNGVQVTSADAPADTGVTGATPDSPVLPGGFYELFSSLTGRQPFTATDSRYQTARKTVDVAADTVTTAGFTLQAGQLSVATAVSGSVRLGGSVTRKLIITNTSRAAASLSLGERTGGFTSLNASSRTRFTPVHLAKGHFSPFPDLKKLDRSSGAVTPAQIRQAAVVAGAQWTPVPGYQEFTAFNSAAYDDSNGKVYSFGGFSGATTSDTTAVYSPMAQSWSQAANMPVGVFGAMAQSVDGKLYVVNGMNLVGLSGAGAVDSVQIYDPSANAWTTGAAPPQWSMFGASATLDGDIYTVGGCAALLLSNMLQCAATPSQDAYRYNPATNTWSAIAEYPFNVADLACGGVAGELVCTGGAELLPDGTTTTSDETWIYNPATNTWSEGADLPIGLWGMSYAAANGQLLVSDGVTDNSTELTNQGFAYNPAANSWTALPNSTDARYEGAGACGFYSIGGLDGIGVGDTSDMLPGYGGCGSDGTSVPWLAATPDQVTVPAGGSVTVQVRLDAGAAGVTQPGAYTAALTLSTDTPYEMSPVAVTMNVTPPKTWGEITGTVSGAACGGGSSPLAGASVAVDSWAGDQALTTDADGQYTLWLDQRGDPLTLIASDDGWLPQTAKVRVKAGQATTTNFTLTPQQGCS